MYKGLNDEDIAESRKIHGSNILTDYRESGWKVFLEVLKEPMVLLLIVVCSLYFFTGQLQEGFIMLVAIIIVSGISVYQQIRSESAVRSLRDLSRQPTHVIRNGEKLYVPSEELVVNDIVIVAEGDKISADGDILDSNDFSVDESILTGEAFPVTKNGEDKKIFSGSTVTSGLAHARITEVGNRTRLGMLGVAMQETEKEKTPLQKQINVFVRRMALFGAIAFIFVWVYNYLESGDWVDGLMHGLTLAMAVLPEEIPVALSTFMALGAYQLIRNNVLVKHPQTVEALGAATVICVDKTGTITENKMSVSETYVHNNSQTPNFKLQTSNLLFIARLACEPVPFDPMEKAIIEACDCEKQMKDYRMIHEYPLSGVHPIMTHVYQNHGERIIACKGAPEGIIRKANLDTAVREDIMNKVKALANKGNRVLAVATADYAEEVLPEDQASYQWNFLGLVALHDPPKKNIASVIEGFYDAGIHVKMITGDFPETASSIAREIGLRQPEKILTGQEIEKMDEEVLKNTVEDITVFARVKPELKLRIIRALKANNEVVAMTGDGVNDGPALKASHIGVAMGHKGTEVARHAASLVLTNDDLSNMVTAVASGRRIYSNLKKAIQYIISIHIPLISIVTLPLILGWKFPNIFTPVHVIFLELVMGPTCSIVYEREPIEPGLMNRKPRKLSSDLFTWKELSLSIIQGIVITAGLMFILYYSIQSSFSEDKSRTLVFSTLIFSNLFLTLTGRSRKLSMIKTLRNRNPLMPLILFLTLFLFVLTVLFPPVQSIFLFQPVSLPLILLCIATAAVSVLWFEIFKYLKIES